MKQFFSCLLLLICTGTGYSQRYRMESLNVVDGLSQGFISCMLQDSRGFLWFGSLDGLNRYDGYQVKRFTNNQATWAFKANSIYCMTESADGLLWLGTEKGVVVMDPYTERFVSLSEINAAFPASQVRDINIQDSGRVWLSFDLLQEKSLFVFLPPADLITRIRTSQLQSTDFNLQPLEQGPGVVPPLFWICPNNDTIIFAVDDHRQFCQVDRAKKLIQFAGTEHLNYERLGHYGLVHARRKMIHILFPLDAKFQALPVSGCYLGFVVMPDEKPFFYLEGTSTLYQVDTSFFQSKNLETLLTVPAGYRRLQPVVEADKPLSYTNIADRSGHLWMATTGHGVRKISRNRLDFNAFPAANGSYNLTRLPDGRLWIGYRRPEVVINVQNGKKEMPPWANALPRSTQAHSLLITHSGDWWMIAIEQNHCRLLKKDRAGEPWREQPVKLRGPNNAIPMYEDRRGNIWLAGVQGQVLRIRPDGHIDEWQIDHLFQDQSGQEQHFTCVVEDEQGILWMGSNHGLVQVDEPAGEPKFQLWPHNRQRSPLKNDWITSIYPEPNSQGVLWLGTRGGGLSRYKSVNGVCEHFTESEGLINNVVYGILPDSFGYLWLSTNRGITRFNPRNYTFSSLLNTDKQLNTEFNTGAYLALPSGELAFGSVEGLFLIRPPKQPLTEPTYVVEITQLKINGINFDPATAEGRIRHSEKNEIILQLPFSQNNLILEFAALPPNEPTSSQYRYRVIGLGEQWTSIGHQHTVNLVAIPPGNYTIELQSIGANGSWANAPVTHVYMTIRPPWFLSWPAWFLYAGLVTLLFYAYIIYERKQLRLKHAGAINRKELERLKSLDDFKNRFFSYVTHEFKTPLTIILGQANRLPPEQQHQKTAIFQQGQSMLEMVDQMVDFIRLDDHKLRLNWRNGNISEYIQALFEAFHPLTETKNVRLAFETSIPDLMMDFDPLRLKHIVSNLLSNALQYTSAGGHITIDLYTNGPNQICIEVSDTGEGISAQDLPHIFDRYYQGHNSSRHPHHFGLGLALVRDLVELFHGKIEVNSSPGEGTIFTVWLPISRDAVPLEDSLFPFLPYYEENTTVQRANDPLHSGRPLLLVVEDNAFITSFLKTCLFPHFLLEFAADGLSGYEKALEIIPDLILTDVMMPGIDGYELTNQLKNHALTGHIPIVMLSARSGLSDRLQGQQFGADAYLGKPFDEQELILTLQNLYQLQRRWRDRYADLPQKQVVVDMVPAQPAEVVQQTDAFMLKIYALFEKNYPHEEYDLAQLCHEMETSPSQLHRKLVALSDQSPMQLLRIYRLQKAYGLLTHNPHSNVKEVCFQVGFKDASHFSRLFSRTFGMAPSEVKKGVQSGF